MNGREFTDTVVAYFASFLEQLGFAAGETNCSGRLYDVQFDHPQYALSISYEPGDDYLLVVLFTRNAGKLSAFDDRTKTLNLPDLNAKFMPQLSPEEKNANSAYFAGVVAATSLEKQLLKSAKELRLCLGKLLT